MPNSLIQNLTKSEAKNAIYLDFEGNLNKPPTYADITLNILSSNNNKVRQIRYIDCIPTSLGDMTLESTSGDVSFITFPASFRFSYFELK